MLNWCTIYFLLSRLSNTTADLYALASLLAYEFERISELLLKELLDLCTLCTADSSLLSMYLRRFLVLKLPDVSIIKLYEHNNNNKMANHVTQKVSLSLLLPMPTFLFLNMHSRLSMFLFSCFPLLTWTLCPCADAPGLASLLAYASFSKLSLFLDFCYVSWMLLFYLCYFLVSFSPIRPKQYFCSCLYIDYFALAFNKIYF